MKKFVTLLVCGLILCLLPGVSLAAESGETAVDVPVGIRLTLPPESAQIAYRLTDGTVASRVSLSTGESITISPDQAANALVLGWYSAPLRSEIVQKNANGDVIQSDSREDGMLKCVVVLLPECASIEVTVSSDCALGEVTAYSAAAGNGNASLGFLPAPEQADLLIVSAEPGLEFGAFGALIPTYARERGMRVAVLYVSDYGKRERVFEGFDGLISAGSIEYPILGNFTCDNYDSYQMASIGFDRERLTDYLKAQIERLNPKVIVTHALSDASGAHSLTAECVLSAARASAGVQKCYTFGAADQATPTIIEMNTPLNTYNGKTAAEIAQRAYDKHVSRRVFGRQIDTTSAYTLAYSTVGDDQAKNDLFEHIDVSTLIAYATATPAAVQTETTIAPETSPTAETTPAPTLTAAQPETAQPESQPAERGIIAELGLNNKSVLLALALGVGGSGAMLLFAYRRLKRRNGKGDAVCFCLVPFALGLATSAVLAGTKIEQVKPAASPMVAQAATEQPAVTDQNTSPTPAPAASVEPTEDPVAVFEENYYRKSGDPAEVIVADSEHGHWAYRTDDLGIDIERVSGENSAGKPVVYFVADIHMKDMSQFRPGFAAESHAGRGADLPYLIARREKAVLWMTGDNLIHDKQEMKGILIRDGRIFWSANAEDTLAFYPDRTMRIIPKQLTSAQTLLEDGVENAYSFGPALISGGSINRAAKYNLMTRANPRAGIGEIEPGHWIAIVVERRAMRDSVGLTLEEFAALFADYGCQTAYNLNGGRSAAMVFMGEQLNSHAGGAVDPDGSVQRVVADGLTFGYSNQVPGVNDPVQNDGRE